MSDKAKNLTEFIHDRFGTTEPEVPASVAREQERQTYLREKGDAVRQWRAYITQAEPAKRVDGKQLGALTEALGGVGFVSEVLCLRPDDVQRAIAHSATTFLSDAAVRKFITAAQTVVDGAR
jgi:hypothetical protein